MSADSEFPGVAVVVPVYRNEPTLAELARRVASALGDEPSGFRIVFVDDASPDNSWTVVKELARNDARVAGLRLAENVGQHRALLAGIGHCAAGWYAILDADLQDPPEYLRALLSRAKGIDGVVFGCRLGQYQSASRMLSSRLFKTLLGWATGLPANSGTYLMIPRRVAAAMVAAPVSRPQVVVMARHFSDNRANVDFPREPRAIGTSAYGFAGRVRAAHRAWSWHRECRRGSAIGLVRPVAVAEVVNL